MDKKIRWGILSTAKIGTEKVIPALKKGAHCRVEAIASRDGAKAAKVAAALGIPNSYGSYEELLKDPEIDAVYNPLPNHLHVPWSIRAIEAGKHVLCEKPIGMNAEEAQRLADVAARHSRVKVMEAFMYKFHPQWTRVKALLSDGVLGEVRSIHSVFFYYNTNPDDIRNRSDIGGGGLMDIGCYCISFPRYILGREPEKVLGILDVDPKMKIDRLATGVLSFADGVSATISCGTQLEFFQRCTIHGSRGTLTLGIPVNAPAGENVRLALFRKGKAEEIRVESADQYTLQGDTFAKAILNGVDLPVPLQDAVNNMKVIDALVESSRTMGWVSLDGRP